MDNFDKGLDDLLDMTDTEESSSSSNPGLFETTQPFVLELHELKKDDLGADPVTQDSKIKKKKRKKTKPASENKSHATSSTSSVSDSVPAIADAPGKEEFYDAKESYHALAEDSQAKPAASLALTQAHSEHTTDKHTTDKRSDRRSSTVRDPSTISKSVAPSD